MEGDGLSCSVLIIDACGGGWVLDTVVARAWSEKYGLRCDTCDDPRLVVEVEFMGDSALLDML